MILYRVFVEDVGPGRFSAIRDANASNPKAAILLVTETDDPYANDQLTWCGRKLIALPHSRKDLWPDGKTGDVPSEALTFH